MDYSEFDQEIGIVSDLLETQAPLSAFEEGARWMKQMISHMRNLKQLLEQTHRELADLRLMHESTIEHATEIENELEHKNARITELTYRLRKYLPEALYDQVMDGQLESGGPHLRKRLTILFSDIVEFTTLTDHLEPEMLSEILNSYFDSMAGLVNKWGGVIDKFIGDAVMVFFGDKAGSDFKIETEKCVLLAIEMQQQMTLLRQRWADDGLLGDWRIRIGINTGYCTLGSFGSEKRMDYTIIGGQVNAASRLEHMAPPGGILISGSTHLLVADRIECLPRGAVTLKGIHQPVDTFEVVRERDSAAHRAFLDESERGFHLRSVRFDHATASRIERAELRLACQRALQILQETESDS